MLYYDIQSVTIGQSLALRLRKKSSALIADTRNTMRELEKLLHELRENPEYKKNKHPFLAHFTLSNRSTAINYRG